ncbi:MAG TPA: hypothetical protein PKY50_17255 [Candidatus Competibacter sp.]|nr:hypothetical protein [Candidatus Competibacter sp.]
MNHAESRSVPPSYILGAFADLQRLVRKIGCEENVLIGHVVSPKIVSIIDNDDAIARSMPKALPTGTNNLI